MAHYRIYTLKKGGHIALPPKDIHADTDEQAIQEARKFLDGHDIEVWQGSRRLVALTPKK